jgi:hypothetical protein
MLAVTSSQLTPDKNSCTYRVTRDIYRPGRSR